MLERRHVVGGAAVTEEFHPGFRNSVAAYTVSLLNPKVIRDLDLHAHGLQDRRARDRQLPADARRAIPEHRRRPHASEEVAKFSRKDADRLDAYAERLEVIADVLRELVLETPPNVVEGGWRVALPEMLRAANIGGRFSKLDLRDATGTADVVRHLGGRLSRRLVRERSDQGRVRLRRHRRQLRQPLRAGLGVRAAASRVRRGQRQERRVGSRHRRHGRDHAGDGEVCGLARRGHSRQRGRDAKSSSRTAGPSARSPNRGETFRASAVVSNLNPKLLFMKLIDPGVLPPAFRQRISQWRCGSGTFRMNVALSELPDFTCLPGKQRAPHHTAGIIIAPTLALHGARVLRCASHGWSKEPIVEVLIPSTLDDSLAPPGQHVASMFCQHVAPELPNGAIVGRASRDRRGSDDRDRQRARAEFQSIGARPPDQQPARSGANLRPDRRRHLPRRADPRSDVLGAADARAMATIAARCPAYICAAPARIPAAA